MVGMVVDLLHMGRGSRDGGGGEREEGKHQPLGYNMCLHQLPSPLGRAARQVPACPSHCRSPAVGASCTAELF